MISYAPLSLALFMLVIFVFSQIRTIRFHSLHYLFLASINVFYFLFVAYLIRFFDITATLGISMNVRFFIKCPALFDSAHA